MQSSAEAKRKAKLWAAVAPKFHLLSFQLGHRMMSISANYPRHNPKRILAVKLASQCANAAAIREFKAQKRDVILNAELEIQLLPDLTRYQWGRGAQLGQLVRKSSKSQSSHHQTSFQVFTFSLPAWSAWAPDHHRRRQSPAGGESGRRRRH